jgi:hypothetical protein
MAISSWLAAGRGNVKKLAASVAADIEQDQIAR